jgi:hypothetical protein
MKFPHIWNLKVITVFTEVRHWYYAEPIESSPQNNKLKSENQKENENSTDYVYKPSILETVNVYRYKLIKLKR